MLMTRPKFCADRPDTCKRMAHALAAALKYVHEDRKAAYDILKAHFPKFDDKLLAMAFDDVEKVLAQSPVIQEVSIANSDKMNIDAGFMQPDQARVLLQGPLHGQVSAVGGLCRAGRILYPLTVTPAKAGVYRQRATGFPLSRE